MYDAKTCDCQAFQGPNCQLISSHFTMRHCLIHVQYQKMFLSGVLLRLITQGYPASYSLTVGLINT